MPDENANQAQRELSEATQKARRELKRIERVIAKIASKEQIDWGDVGDMQRVATMLERVTTGRAETK